MKTYWKLTGKRFSRSRFSFSCEEAFMWFQFRFILVSSEKYFSRILGRKIFETQIKRVVIFVETFDLARFYYVSLKLFKKNKLQKKRVVRFEDTFRRARFFHISQKLFKNVSKCLLESAIDNYGSVLNRSVWYGSSDLVR